MVQTINAFFIRLVMRLALRIVIRGLKSVMWIIVIVFAPFTATASTNMTDEKPVTPTLMPDEYAVFTLNADLSALSKSQVKMLYRGKLSHVYSTPITLLDLPEEHKHRVQFYQLILGKDPTQMKRIWAKQTFSGRTRPPTQIEHASQDAIKQWLERHPTGIAYGAAELIPDGVKILYRQKMESAP